MGVWNRTTILLARTTRNCAGLMNTSLEQETSIIYVTYVRTKGHRCTPRHNKYLLRRAGPCGEAMPTRGPGKGRLSHAAEGWQGADATSMTVSFVLTRVLCAVFFFPTTGQRKKSSSLWALGRHAIYRCIAQHAPRTHCPSHPGGVD